ncbi:MAG: hypothetical protein WA632_01640 [Gallionella sp.]
MKTVMDMSNYDVDLNEIETGCGDDMMIADWDPSDDMLCGMEDLEPTDDISTATEELVLRKMYSYLH